MRSNIRLDVLAYGKLAALKLGYVSGQVEVTSKCFQHCIACESWRDHHKGSIQGQWSLGQLMQFVRECAEFPTFEHLSLTGGDPQAWPELEEFLSWWVGWRHAVETEHHRRLRLQLNTALCRDIPNPSLWLAAVDDVRVSLDAVTPTVYRQIRGDKDTTPAGVLRRIQELRHPRLATNTTVYPQNVQEVPKILVALEELARQGVPVRRAIFLLGIGHRVGPLDQPFIQSWKEAKEWYQDRREVAGRVEANFAEDPMHVRTFLDSGQGDAVPCYAGNVSFHVKCNGDLYPCCLVGGEAIPTAPELRIGNVWDHSVEYLWKKHVPETHYSNPALPCRSICQFKQLQMNLAGQLAAETTLAMP